ncbi:MAG TPA: MazG nucleotide pyrophosphohydrolase domain-containing protein [Candidatus Thermoplasmatota archaeon]|nr:MazG nucleotide pyrophosphohydrolase domain-containing protein [Candidatus Thermoplasmatota archaeon]
MRVSEFQRHIAELYLEKDKRRGAEGTMLWLIEEVGEMTEAARRKELDALAAEMADVLAWTASLANLYGVDLEAALARKYPATCRRCDSKPCACPEPKQRML